MRLLFFQFQQIHMQYTDFSQKYPFLNARLIGWASSRIAKTSDYLEAEAKGRINALQHKINHRRLDLPAMRRMSEFFGEMSVEQFNQSAMLDDEYRYLHEQIELEKQGLKSIKATTRTPTLSQIREASEQVKDYVSALQSPAMDTFLLWHQRLSSREKYFISKCAGFLRDEDWIDQSGKNLPAQVFEIAYHEWGYLDQGYSVLNEPVEKSFFKDDRLIGAITSNSYGVHCLNAPHTMFVDIDLDIEAEDCSGMSFPWGRYHFAESQVMEAIAQAAKDWGLRFEAYKTRNGMRLLETSAEWNPQSTESATVLEFLGCDRLFQQLCRTQGCYRARLDPKPWREVVEEKHSVCHYLGVFGNAPENSAAQQIKQIHDSWCVGGGSLA